MDVNSYVSVGRGDFNRRTDMQSGEQEIQLATPVPAAIFDDRRAENQLEAAAEFPFHFPIRKDGLGID